MRDFLEKKTKSGKTYGQCIGETVWVLVCAFFFLQMILNLSNVTEAGYQTFKDYYSVIAGCFFLLALVPVQKVRFTNLLIYIFAAVYTVLAVLWLRNNEIPGSVDINNIYRVKCVFLGIAGILLVDLISGKKFQFYKSKNWIGFAVFLVPMLYSFLVSKGAYYSQVPLVIIVALFLQHFTLKTWKRWVFSFTLGYYGAFLYTVVNSFMEVPYVGNRYYGTYVTLYHFGVFMAGAFLCSLWWMIVLIQKKAPIWQRLLAGIPVLFAMTCMLMNGARTSVIAMFVMLVIVFIFWGGRREKKSVLIRFAVVAVLLFVFAIAGYNAVKYLLEQDVESFKEWIPNEVVYNNVAYWYRKFKGSLSLDSRIGIIEDGSYWNIIDRFLTTRLSYWIVYARELNWFGHQNMALAITDEHIGYHPHNQILYWSYGMGILAGALLTIWQIYFIVVSLVRSLKGKEECIFPFLWVTFFFMTGMTETMWWLFPIGIGVLILYYPLTRRFSRSRKRTSRKDKNGKKEKCVVKKEE